MSKKNKSFWSSFRQSITLFTKWLGNKKYNFKDRLRYSLVGVFGFFVFAAIGIITYSNVVPRPSNMNSTPLNEAQSFGTLGKTVTLTSRELNPDTGTILLNFKFSDNENSDVPVINMKKISIKLDGDNLIIPGRSEAKIIPTSPDTLAVQMAKINSKFRAAKIKFSDKSLDPSQIQQTISDTSSSGKRNKPDNPVATFIVNNDKIKLVRSLKLESQKELALKQNTLDILDERSKITKNKSAIKKWNKSIEDQKNNIEIAQSQLKNADQDSVSNLENSIEDYRSKISSAKELIRTTETELTSEHDRIVKLQEYRQEIIEGRAGLAKPY